MKDYHFISSMIDELGLSESELSATYAMFVNDLKNK